MPDIINKPKILKSENLSSMDKLNKLQQASLYGTTSEFIDTNTELINNIAQTVQSVISTNNKSIGGSTPEFIANAAKTRTDISDKQTSKNAKEPITGMKWLTEMDQDMDLFRELFPIATPMFELFYEYQMVYQMIPEVAKCMDVLKNSILSADNFSKKYLIPRYDDAKLSNNLSEAPNESTQKNVNLINDIIEEYDLNHEFDLYISDAMKYGAKPVMIVPIDKNFRESAKKVLTQEESNTDFAKYLKSVYNDGQTCTFENYIEDTENAFITTENKEITGIDYNKITQFGLNLNNDIDDMISIYEDNFNYESGIIDVDDMTEEEKNKFNQNIKSRKDIITNTKDIKNRKTVMKSICNEVAKMVNNKVHFSIMSENIALPLIHKVVTKNKTMRKIRNRRLNVSSSNVTNEAFYIENPDILDKDINNICTTLESSKFTKYITQNKNYKSITTENANWIPNNYDNIDLEDEYNYVGKPIDMAPMRNSKPLDISKSKENTLDEIPTGSVVIPLAPDTVVPISVHGKHIGYYVIERLGNDDLGSGVATLLGYKSPSSMYSIGLAGKMAMGQGALSGADGAGVILKDMTDLPMNVKDDGRRIDLLRNMIIRAVSERVGNPDIVDDKPFNSIIYSLIKDHYITNREIKITYVPANMMVYWSHSIDPDTGIGVSLLEKSLFFAHVYIASLITNLMISISKSADREQINVEVGSGKRYEAIVQKVMRTLQTKRASIDSIGNVDTIMKSLGTFQRYISLKHNGQSLVEMETIPGQQVDLDNSLQEKALKSVVNSFNVPSSALNLLDDAEYSRSISLQNALFLDQVVNMQLPYQQCATKTIRILTRNKYPDKVLNIENITKIKNSKKDEINNKLPSTDGLIDISKVYIDFPSPQGLSVTSLNDQINNVDQFADKIIEITEPIDIPQENEDAYKRVMKLNLYKKLLPGLPYEEYVDMIANAKEQIELQRIKAKSLGKKDNDASTFDSGSTNFNTTSDDNSEFKG